jgi:hypothetical protein
MMASQQNSTIIPNVSIGRLGNQNEFWKSEGIGMYFESAQSHELTKRNGRVVLPATCVAERNARPSESPRLGANPIVPSKTGGTMELGGV